MTLKRRWTIVILALVLIIITLAGCQQISNILRPKSATSSSSSSAASSGGKYSITDCKFVSTWIRVQYPMSSGLADDRSFTMLNIPISFNGLTFSGKSTSVFDYCNSHGAGNKPDCIKSYECELYGNVSQDKKKLEKVNCSVKIINDDENSSSGKYEINGIPFSREQEVRTIKDCQTFHSYYKLSGDTLATHIVSIGRAAYSKKGYTEIKQAEFKWDANSAFEYVFKLKNCDVN